MNAAGTVEVLGAVLVALAGTAIGAYILRSSRALPPEYRRPTSLFGWSLLVWAAGAALWTVLQLLDLGHSSGPRGLANVGYVAATLLYSVAMLVHPALAPNVERLRVIANAVVVAASMFTILWYGAARHLHERSGDVVEALTALAYPASDIVLITVGTAIVVRLSRRRGSLAATARSSAAMALAAFVCFFVGDLYHLVVHAHAPQRSATLVTEVSWIVGFLALGASMRVASHPGRATTRGEHRRLASALGNAPVVAAILAGGAATMDWLVRDTLDPTGTLMLTAVVSMVLARQSLTLRDNHRLSATLQKVVADLEHQAGHDALTGLPNRAGLPDRIRHALEHAERRGRRAALFFVDLDHLKPVNDSLGHAAGDVLLRTTADRIAARVGPRLTRFGGDEFVVVLDDLPAADPTAAAELLGRRVVAEAARPIEIDGHVIRPSVSVGVAIAATGMGPEELMRRADLALYRAKARGRRRVVTYDAATEPDARRLIDLESELRRAIRHDEFEVHYQPVVELATGRITGVESLLRWRHPDRGLLTPDAFLDEAARCGLLGTIGERTLMRVCADLAPLGHGSGPDPLGVAVNMSTTELADSRLIQRVATALETFGMDPARLVIEITEDVIIDDDIRSSIDRLKALGVGLAIDDFGTGNSSLRQLGTYPAETLKIDRSFIASLDEDPHHTAVVRAILGLARNLGLRSVAEGVETPTQERRLTEMGCDMAQGWLYARALGFDELVQHLAARGTVPTVPQMSTLDRRMLGGAARSEGELSGKELSGKELSGKELSGKELSGRGAPGSLRPLG